MDTIEFNVLQSNVEDETGFKCYEGTPGTQSCWYGTSPFFNDFKSMVANKLATGTIAYLMDTKVKMIYDKFSNAWFEI